VVLKTFLMNGHVSINVMQLSRRNQLKLSYASFISYIAKYQNSRNLEEKKRDVVYWKNVWVRFENFWCIKYQQIHPLDVWWGLLCPAGNHLALHTSDLLVNRTITVSAGSEKRPFWWHMIFHPSIEYQHPLRGLML
jgi:hypothetical protein